MKPYTGVSVTKQLSSLSTRESWGGFIFCASLVCRALRRKDAETQEQVKDQQQECYGSRMTKPCTSIRVCLCVCVGREGSCGSACVFSGRAATLPLMSLRVAETERLMHSGSSPLTATGLPRATADDSFNCFQSFRLVPAHWRRVLVCVCFCVRAHACGVFTVTVIVCGCCTHMWCVFDGCVCPL